MAGFAQGFMASHGNIWEYMVPLSTQKWHGKFAVDDVPIQTSIFNGDLPHGGSLHALHSDGLGIPEPSTSIEKSPGRSM